MDNTADDCICGDTGVITVLEFVTDENGEPVLHRDMHILERRVTVPCPDCTVEGRARADRQDREAQEWQFAQLAKERADRR